jgi:hypothetical protein
MTLHDLEAVFRACEQMGMSRNTVRKYVEQSEPLVRNEGSTSNRVSCQTAAFIAVSLFLRLELQANEPPS